MGLKAKFETLRSLANGSISGSYAAVGTAVSNPVKVFCITNNTDGDMIFSLNGTNDHIFVAKNSFKLFDLTANKQGNEYFLQIPVGTIFYVKQSSAPSTGSVYVEVVYAA
jgi:hypothetical protein